MTIRGAVVWPLGPREAFASADAVVEPHLATPRPPRAGDPEPVDGLLVPAFADWHLHWVQLGLPPAAGRPLLRWLEELAWPAEARFASAAFARIAAPLAVERLRAVGTLAGAAYGSPHAATADEFLRSAGDGFVCGPAVMTAGPPDALRRDAAASLAELARLADRHDDRLAVSPRFALSVDDATLAALGALASERGLPVQTHLAETVEECARVAERYHGERHYADVYDRAGLIGPRTLLGHVVHVGDDELDLIAGRRAVAVHCPTSNLALASGRMPLERLRAARVRWVLGSDVGAGPEPCLLDVIAAAQGVQAGHAELTAVEAFHRATIGRAALFEGASENPLSRLDDRPGVLLVEDPGGDPQDPEARLRAWLARRRAGRGHGIRTVLPWGALPQTGPDRLR